MQIYALEQFFEKFLSVPFSVSNSYESQVLKLLNLSVLARSTSAFSARTKGQHPS